MVNWKDLQIIILMENLNPILNLGQNASDLDRSRSQSPDNNNPGGNIGGNRRKKRKPKLDVEDYVLDCILNEQIQTVNSLIINNRMKKDFYTSPISFTIENNKLKSHFDSNIPILKAYMEGINEGEIWRSFEETIIEVLKEKHLHLNKFNKFIYRPNRTVAQGLAIFVIWLSRYLDPKTFNYVFAIAFLTLFVQNRKVPDGKGFREYFWKKIAEETNFDDAEEIEVLYRVIFEEDGELALSVHDLLSHIADYFFGYDLLRDDSNL